MAFLAPINFISEFATPISMSFRHYGNVLSGSVISVLIATALAGLSNMVLGNLPGFLKGLSEKGMKIYAGVPDSNAVKITEADMTDGVVSIIGNEGNGITEETLAAATHLVTIPMKGRAESLNAAAAASIMIWEMMR